MRLYDDSIAFTLPVNLEIYFLCRLARELRVSAGRVRVPSDLRVVVDGAKALWPMRGHQYTAAHHPSMCVMSFYKQQRQYIV